MTKDILQEQWYYSIETEPGIFTKGHGHPNVSLTRALLRGVQFDNTNCLDIGTQEGVLPVLMKRAGAKTVTAYDRWQLQEKIDLVKKVYSMDFDYISGRQLTELPAALSDSKHSLFDVVLFSGVLYHLINPLGLLSVARSFCREGGLFLVETAALQDQGMALHFNAAGKLYGQHANYFIPTTNCLDYFLRMLRLKPIKALYLGSETDRTPRVAVLCRAVSTPIPFGGEQDDWINSDKFSRDLKNEYAIDWSDLANNLPQVPVTFDENRPIVTRGLYTEIETSQPYQPAPRELALFLDSTM